MGASRRAHHRQQEAMRAANEEANRMRAIQEESRRQYQAMIDALKPQAAVDIARPPRPIQSTIDDARGGIRTARSTRGTIKGLSRGLAQLRIPLNIGGGAGGGLNIG